MELIGPIRVHDERPWVDGTASPTFTAGREGLSGIVLDVVALSSFDGKAWTTFPEATGPRYSEPYGFISALPGADGATILESHGHAFHFVDDRAGWRKARRWNGP